MSDSLQLPVLRQVDRPSVADQVFGELHRQVLSLELKPGAKLSEVEVARQMGVSRQPVRDAFYRLSKLGFLLIRPQRATTVTLISSEAVMQARFIRTALEVETVRAGAKSLTDADLDVLRGVLERQKDAVAAGDRSAFHQLDDRFHKEICDRSGVGFAWDLILENKGHMDRVRMLSLAFASQTAFNDHVAIFNALKARDELQAAEAMRQHLSRIREQIDRIRADNHDFFAGDEA
ncbi:putative HTH-type transcriptional regulator YdfH [Hartmannibacter diazotrophicus]|uniref:Putative HTH-type transcriptional regulator YdfH n=1 Tax=Hartmannibacter diazotrophicus TaxID=1482074 RepID=A0A2C9DCT9_9HYPH|nr:GntR family transcriptional regulator [Hartmannibacter diazotrophicus]SON58142.1 putative HTH-type transcriptional regulator YdfH [Hartmannibacter diazotrophicus]